MFLQPVLASMLARCLSTVRFEMNSRSAIRWFDIPSQINGSTSVSRSERGSGSGLGVLAQKPDLRLADGGGFEALPALQLKVLRTAARYVQSGGRLVYSTCTVRGPENREVVCAFLGGDNRFSLVPPPVAPPGAVMQDGMMTLLPNRSAAEGFFVATMERL